MWFYLIHMYHWLSCRPKPSQFPVKITSPRTALLYVTDVAEHLRELKEAIHVQEVAMAPAHAHDVLQRHVLGESHGFAGLPTPFWIVVIFLVLLFHLFLCKLIYSEFALLFS